jgi:hypothetical protein
MLVHLQMCGIRLNFDDGCITDKANHLNFNVIGMKVSKGHAAPAAGGKGCPGPKSKTDLESNCSKF